MAFLAFTLLWSVACHLAAEPLRQQHGVTFTQVVQQADPGLRWVAPAALPFGQPLTVDQLSATANTDGTFTYSPAAGQLLLPGTQMLSVVFTPANLGFHSSSLAVPLVVTPPGTSTFSFQFASSQTVTGGIVLTPGVPVPIQLVVPPVGDFHQPVSFSCSSPRADIQCNFQPQVVRPTTAPATVLLTIESTLAAAVGAQGQPGSTPRTASFSLGFLPTGCMLAFGSMFFRRQHRIGICRTGPLLALSLLFFAISLGGCGTASSGSKALSEQTTNLTLQATSLVDSRFLTIQILSTATQ